MAVSQFDTTPLLLLPTANEVKQYRSTHPKIKRPALSIAVSTAMAGTGVIGLLLLAAYLNSQSSPPLTIVVVLALGVGALIAVTISAHRHMHFGFVQNAIRFERFAQKNNLVYEPAIKKPDHDGAVFALGSARLTTDQFISQKSEGFETGNYQYMTTAGSTPSPTMHCSAYVRITLQQSLPRVMYAQARRGLPTGLESSTIWKYFTKQQIVALDGAGDATLYAAAGDEKVARALFTPDFIHLLNDTFAGCDVEVVDRRLYVYAGRQFDFAQATTWNKLSGLIDAVNDQMVR